VSDVVLLPDVERLVVDFLRDQPELAVLVDDRVYTAIPALKQGEADWRWPLVRVVRFAGRPVRPRPRWLDAPVVQFEAFGGRKAEAWSIAETVGALLSARLVGVHAQGTVTDVEAGSPGYQPDDTYTPAKPRYLFTSTIHTHP
jgi:hypothetical protein